MNKQELQVRRPRTTLLGTSGIALARLVATSAAAGRTFATLIVATIMALMGTLTAEAQTEPTFVHTRGIIDDNVNGWKEANVPAAYSDNLTQYYTSADDPRIENAGGRRQKTHVTEHYIYAKPGETIYLEPYTDFYISNRTQYKESFVRWYDYRTDAKANNLSMYYTDTHTKTYSWGIVGGTALSGTRQSVSVAKLTIPATADIATKPLIIAMDASQSATKAKIERTAGTFTEPLINFRHLFIITDSREHVAEYSNSKEANEKFTRERKRFITARAGAAFQVRLNYMMPEKTGYGSGMLYETATGANERVGQAYIKTFDAQGNDKGEMFKLGNSTTAFEGTAANQSFYRTITCTAANAKAGVYTVRLYAKNTAGNNVYVRGTTNVPLIIQEYEITFVDNTKASFYTEAEMETHKNEIAHQQYDYLNEHYGKPVAVVNYDEYPLTGNDVSYAMTNAGSAVSGTSPTAKTYKWPVDWKDSNYSFGYNNRYDYNMYVLATHSNVTPYHAGADTWPKEKNFPGSKVYEASNSSYRNGLFDRKFYETEGQEQGYFYYINAAGDPGIMARVTIPTLCLGSTLYVTGWVAEFSQTTEKANLIFNFNAVLTDGSSVTLSSYTTGYVPDNEHCGKWYKAYYSFVPNTDNLKGASAQIDHYEVVLENNCTSSGGADYAIDDIRVWVSKPEVRAEQLKPVCSGEKETEVKVSANFQSLLTTMGTTAAIKSEEEEKLSFYYTFIDKDKYEGLKADGITREEAFKQSIVRFQYDLSNTSKEQGYGKLTFSSYFNNNLEPYQQDHFGSDAMRETDNSTEYLVFNTKPYDTNLFPGKEYIIALWAPRGDYEDFVEDEANVLDYYNFLIEDDCAKIKVFRVHASGVVKINGKIVSDQDEISCCENQYPIIQIDAYGMVPTDPDHPDQKETMIIEERANYDWYLGTINEYYAEQSSTTGVKLEDALRNYREYYTEDGDILSAVPQSDHLDASNHPIVFSQEMIDYLIEMTTVPDAKGNIRLQLFKRSCVMAPGLIEGRKACYVVAVPVIRAKYIVNVNGTNIEFENNDLLVCTTPSEIRVFLESHSPHIVHGFANGVNYPEYLEDVPLRIGYDQMALATRPLSTLENFYPGCAAETGILGQPVLSVPLRVVTSTEGNNAVDRIVRSQDAVVYLAETNDPEYSKLPQTENPIVPYPTADADDAVKLPQVGVVAQLEASTKEEDVKGEKALFRMVFCEDFNYKEGYYYRLLFNYKEEYPANYDGEKTECDGQRVITLKIVPKYQKWVGGTNTDYNNDRNWRRISSTELLHDFTGDDDPVRHKVTDGFAANKGEGGYANTLSYVPMNFTDVIIPDGLGFPRLYAPTAANVKAISSKQDGSTYTWNWPQGGYDATGKVYTAADDALKVTDTATATNDIQYDMVAWTRTNDSGVVRGVNCRPWYANTCEHITFLPGAAIHNQQHLNYQRAWVEVELAKDRWYTLTSPLQTTVAGDMYLPTTGKSPARQMTEHFMPIFYDANLNDRFRPAVYQRSWDHGEGTALIYRMDNDGMYNQGHIDHGYVAGTWSHVFNDVEEVYTHGRGFSILTDVSRLASANSIDKVLFRLPKDDTSYYYHNSQLPGNGNNNADGSQQPGDITNNGGLYSGTVKGDYTTIDRTVLQGNDRIESVTRVEYLKDGQGVNAPAAPVLARLNPTSGTLVNSTKLEGKYFLVGNPFMTYLDMEKFFDANTGLERKYWIITDGRQDAAIMSDNTGNLGTAGAPVAVAPMQGFFVETKNATTEVSLTYNEGMMKEVVTRIDATQGNGNNNFALKAPATRSTVAAADATAATNATAGLLRIKLSDHAQANASNSGAPFLMSTAVIALAPAATADYSAKEDAILLLDSNLDEQSAIYTVAGETAVSINSLDRVDIVPLGIICPDEDAAKKMLTLTFEGADAFPQPLYLYDALSGNVTPIDDSIALNVPASSNGQYFITTSIDAIDNVDTTDAGTIYDLKGIRVTTTRNEQIYIKGNRKVLK